MFWATIEVYHPKLIFNSYILFHCFYHYQPWCQAHTEPKLGHHSACHLVIDLISLVLNNPSLSTACIFVRMVSISLWYWIPSNFGTLELHGNSFKQKHVERETKNSKEFNDKNGPVSSPDQFMILLKWVIQLESILQHSNKINSTTKVQQIFKCFIIEIKK